MLGLPLKAPLAELTSAIYRAREIMVEVGRESRWQTWRWISIMVLLGVILGAFGSYYFYNRDIGRIEDRLDSMQQQITPPVPVPDAKPADGKATKGKRGH